MDQPEIPDATISMDKIRDAASRLKGLAVRTPLLESPALNTKLDARVLIKPEVLQRTGSFKFRGAYTRISRIDPERLRAGVVAYSSGNHAQGVAHAAALLGCHATIVMPKDAPPIKIENTRGFGADVILYDRYSENREEIGRQICDEKGATLIPPYDDIDVISGQATVGVEIVEDLAEKSLTVDRVLVPCGGGGLISGTATVFDCLSPETEVWGVEPEGFDDTARSLVDGLRVANAPEARTICDALASPLPGEITFAINKALLAGCLAVSETNVANAMVEAFQTFKIVVEPGGAVALAAILSAQLDIRGQTVVVICSGGNADPELFSQILAGKRVFRG